MINYLKIFFMVPATPRVVRFVQISVAVSVVRMVVSLAQLSSAPRLA